MTDEEAKKIIFQAAIDLTRGVLANPASAEMLNDIYQMGLTIQTSVNVAKVHFNTVGFQVEEN